MVASVCRPSSIFSKDFFSETTGPILFKFNTQPPGKGGKKVYIFRPGHKTMMAAMPIYARMVKTLKIFFSRTTRSFALKLRMYHPGS